MSKITDIDIRAIIFGIIDELNEMLPPDNRLAKSEDTLLSGSGGGLDSLGMVNLIVDLEEELSSRFGHDVNLIDDGTMHLESDPFRTIGTLIEFVKSLAPE